LELKFNIFNSNRFNAVVSKSVAVHPAPVVKAVVAAPIVKSVVAAPVAYAGKTLFSSL
jgi:hypothetical protein